MKVRDIIRLIELDDWYLVAQKGSHRQYKHAVKPGRVTIAGKESHDIAPGTNIRAPEGAIGQSRLPGNPGTKPRLHGNVCFFLDSK